MRRLLAAVVTVGLIFGLGLQALALTPALAITTKRVPRDVKKISVTLTFPLQGHKPEHRTLARAATVAEVVSATDALRAAGIRGVCPMIVRLGPELTVVFRNARGSELAEAQVQVVQGTRGSSGSSRCFPIRFTRGHTDTALLGNRWVRMMGRLIGTAIS